MSEQEEVKWFIGGEESPPTHKLPYVGTWKTFSSFPDEDKEKLFNAMRAELIISGRLEQK